MAKSKKQKEIIREIPSKIKVLEKEKKGKEEAAKEQEESLEDITSAAPSGKEFPAFSRRQEVRQEAAGEGPETRIITPSGTTEEEGRSAEIYRIQQGVTEKELGRIYRSTSETRPVRAAESAQITTDSRDLLRSREVEFARGPQTEEEKYTISLEPEQPQKRKRYPWEA